MVSSPAGNEVAETRTHWPAPTASRQNPALTLRDVIARFSDFTDDETIYAESPAASAQAIVALEPENASGADTAAGLPYLLEVAAAREAIEVWQAWRPGRCPTLDDKLAAVIYYAEHDAWLPVE